MMKAEKACAGAGRISARHSAPEQAAVSDKADILDKRLSKKKQRDCFFLIIACGAEPVKKIRTAPLFLMYGLHRYFLNVAAF